MLTDNERRVVMCYDDLRELIRKELAMSGEEVAKLRELVSKFREELTVYMDEDQRDRKLKSEILNIQGVADRYGVSKATVHNWMKQGLIKGFKQGKGRFFYPDELDQSLTRYKYFERLKDIGEIPKDQTHRQFLTERGK